MLELLHHGDECFKVAIGLAASQLSEKLELVVFNSITTFAIVAIKLDIDHLSRVVLVLAKADFAYTFGRSKNSDTHLTTNLHFVVLWRYFQVGLVDIDPTAPSEN